MSWSATLQEGNETAKVHDRIAMYVSGRGLDLGCGPWKLDVPKSRDNYCLGVDGGYHVDAKGVDIVADVTDLGIFATETFDYVYSSHTLEDLHYTEAVLREWWRLVKPGGNFILYLPLTKNVAKELGREDWEQFYPNRGESGANVHHQHDFSPAFIRDLIARIGTSEVLVDEVRGEKDEYSFLQVYRKLASSTTSAIGGCLAQGAQKRACVVRYGAIGDFLQSVPVLKKLKGEGYHVTLNCSEVAKEVLKYCPYVDEFAVQLKDYVPNKGVVSGPLFEYWKELSTKYDKFINLTGAAEETLLVPDARLMSMMEQLKAKHPELNEQNQFYNAIRAVREQVGDQNYYDNHLKKAGYTETGLNGELFFSDSETLMGEGFYAKYADRFIVMWVLSGSSYHKRYPYFQQCAQELVVRNPDILLVSVGDPECALLERSESNKYLPRSGRWNLRTSLNMTRFVDLVIGPETGILNAAGCFDTPKITMLSHSSHANLCKYWKNDYCIAVEQKDVFCHPCHVLHYVHRINGECQACGGAVHKMENASTPMSDLGGMWTCPYEVVGQDKSGVGAPAPLCTSRLTPDKVIVRINEVYAKWKAGYRSQPQVRSMVA